MVSAAFRIALLWAGTVLFSMALSSCQDEHETEIELATRPGHFPEAVYQHATNVYSRAGFELGLELFFDPALSVDFSTSCASCHKPAFAFSDAPNALSRGVNDSLGARNSPPIFNLAWSSSFMWDGGVKNLELVSFAPITHPKEMSFEMGALCYRLNKDADYSKKFMAVFHKDSIDAQQILWALTQYMSNLVSANSKYDQYLLRQTSLSEQELQGLDVFRMHCATCHPEPLFTDYTFHNTGLDSLSQDPGRYRISLNMDDYGAFKVPSLRNLSFTAPYMHDGRF